MSAAIKKMPAAIPMLATHHKITPPTTPSIVRRRAIHNPG